MNLYKVLTLKFSENFEKQSVVSLDLCFTGPKLYSTVPNPTERCQTPQYGVTTDRLRFPIYGSSQWDPAEEDKQRKVVFAFFDHVGREGDSYKPELGSLCNP